MKVLVSLLIAACCLLVLPSAALAVTYTVDSTLDEPDANLGTGGCATAGGKCTLRAAIQEANFDSGADTIKFAAAFNGEVADSIPLGSSLPAIEFPLTIDGDAEGAGGQCTTEAGVKGPCAETTGPAGGSALIVKSDKVAIEGLSVTGQTGGGSAVINVIEGSEEFRAADNWLGVRLDGTSSGNTKGIFLDPGSDKAVIGGVNAAERNVIANNGFEGLDIEGASEATVQGNYFGVKPDGITAAPNGKNIEITNTVAFEATDNEVGATIEGPALESAACDGGCNVIAGGGLDTGVDLNGDPLDANEEPATGPTTVHGNYIGLGADGTTVVANGTFDVLAGAAEDVTVGGEAEGDANYIAGGGFGIYHENGEGFAALGNVIGEGPTGIGLTSPGTGVFLYSPSTADGPLVAGNTIVMGGGTGVESKMGGATIIENFIEGGGTGIYTIGLSPAVGNLIAANEILAASFNGILLEGDENEVLANAVAFSGEAGIKVKQAGPPFATATTGNVIGGDEENEENLIFSSGGPAIEIVDLEGSQNEVARNRGSENEGLFIDLRAFEPGTEPNGPNGGIKPPTISVAKQSETSGTAEPGATVRVFRKQSGDPGELKSFLGKAVADGSGNWKVTYPASIPGGTIVAATQTNVEGGTSELSTATSASEPSNGGGGSGGKDDKAKDNQGKAKAKGKGGKDDSGGAPQTTIRKAKVKGTTATFKFTSNTKGAKFECKLDRKKFKACKSPKTYKKLKPGKHVFKVRAVKGKSVDPTPAKRKFKIVE
ncbi:MAG TPA: CSLREA domain-containing protein [Solirubrobacterales bacterium]|nr:CSLREA domain-containing protein [Solirubrobacterales bacterium]